jgi:integrase
MAAARKSSRYGYRDATMILIGYRHGLRASELCDLQWSRVELTTGRLHVRRAKNGSPSVHPMQGDEIRALRRLQREQGLSSHVFMSERDGPMTPKAFHALFGRIGSKMQFLIHPHMLRHGCGYALANAGHDTRALQAWLGHKNISATPSWRRTGSRTSGDRRLVATGVTLGRGRSRSAYPPVQNDSGLAQGPAGASRAS